MVTVRLGVCISASLEVDRVVVLVAIVVLRRDLRNRGEVADHDHEHHDAEPDVDDQGQPQGELRLAFHALDDSTAHQGRKGDSLIFCKWL